MWIKKVLACQLNCLLFWVESVAQVRRIIVQILLKFYIVIVRTHSPWSLPACPSSPWQPQPCLVIFCAKKCSTNSAENCPEGECSAEGECGSETECCVGAECPAGTKCQMQKCTQQTRPKIALKVNVTLKLNVALELNIKLKVNVKHAKLCDKSFKMD